MDFDDLINRLDKFSRTINKSVIGLTLIEAVLVILIGILSNVLSSVNYADYALIVLVLLYLLLLIARTAYIRNFPGSISDELKSERELRIIKSDVERQNTLNELFVSTMAKLNGQTCALNLGDDTNLCDKGITQGVYDLIEPLINNTHYLFNTNQLNFTTGMYLSSFCSMKVESNWDSGVIMISDRLEKQQVVKKDLLSDDSLIEEQLEIQTAIRKSFNNNQFIRQDYKAGNQEFTIVCSPFPTACNENDILGVFFIISKKIKDLPGDTETKLTIFNRVIANWIYRYNECVQNRIL
jgi:hypothetical protein